GVSKKLGGQTNFDLHDTKILPGLIEPDVFFGLQTLPGVQSVNETVTNINIRGGSNDQNLILWDGIKLYQTAHFFGLISAINPYIIARTSIIKNGTPSELGEGVSGTVQVSTSDRRTDTLKAEAGSNMINSDLFLEVPLRKTNIMLASRKSISGILTTPTYERYFRRVFVGSEIISKQPGSQADVSDPNFDFYDVSLNIIHNISDQAKIKAGGLRLDNELKYAESAVVGGDLISKVSRLDQQSQMGYLSYDQRWSDRFRVEAFASLTDYEQTSVNFDVMADQKHILENEVLESQLKLKGIYSINDRWGLSGGMQLVETGIRNLRDINKPKYLSLSKEVLRTTGMFAEIEVSPFLNAHAKVGLRGNYFDKTGLFRMEPRLALIYRFSDALSMELLGESKSQTTVQVVDFQTDFLGVEKRKWELINGKDIPLLTSQQVSLGFNYQIKWLLISLDGFYKQVEGLVSSSQGFLNQFQYVRVPGELDAKGIELLLNPKFDAFSSWVTYSYLDSDYSFSDLFASKFRNNFDITHALSCGFSYQIKNIRLSSGMHYRSGIPFTTQLGMDQNTAKIIYDDPNTSSLEHYFRMDLSATYELELFDDFSVNWGVSVWNLTNKTNIINSFYQVQDQQVERINRSALGITPNLSLRVAYQPGKNKKGP
ncbi:MAG: TonB-dependent receptor, partial [Vicingaceae bacterium]